MNAALGAIGLANPMGERKSGVSLLLEEHAVVLGRVAMALAGDASRAEQVLEQVARDAGLAREVPPNTKPLTWLLGLTRVACATQQSKLPLRNRTQGFEAPPPNTERLGASEAVPARAALAALKPTEREAVVLSLVGGLEAADVATACGVDLGTAKTRIARGVEQLLSSASASREGEGGAR